MSIRAIVSALLTWAIYAGHDAIVKYLGASFSTYQLIFFTTLFSFPLVLFLLLRDGTPGTLRPVHLKWNLARMLSMVAATALAFYAFTTIPLAQAYSLLFMTPLIVTLLSVPMLGERVGLHRGIAVVIGLVGVVIVLQPGAAPLQLGHLAALAVAFLGAFSMTIVRKIGKDERPILLMLYPLLANFVIMGAIMPFVYLPMSPFEMGLMALMAFMFFVGGLLLIDAYRFGEAALVAPMQYTQIVWASIIGYVIFGDILSIWTVLGASVIIASGVYSLIRETMKKAPTPTPAVKSVDLAA